METEHGGKAAGLRIALLSNVNMDFVIRMLREHLEIYAGEGYGNELGVLMNPDSSYQAFAPDVTFLVEDLMELLGHDLEPEAAGQAMDRWFLALRSALKPERVYYVSDACLWGAELEVAADAGRGLELEWLWQERLRELCRSCGNVRMLPYRRLLEEIGLERAFSPKMWYMGKILLSSEAQKRLCRLILERTELETRVPRKVLLLDLDNTLWGGLAGENDQSPIALSEEHIGLAYKNLQRAILQMQRQGVLLGIVSKNNEADAMEILEKHPHMILRPEMFAARRINWEQKHINIRQIAEELNLGEDSFVFWDDSPEERQLVRELLPQVAVPDFPERPEELAAAMAGICREYFAKPSLTREDLDRTAQYAAIAREKALRREAGSFEEYLRSLEIVARRVDPERHMERLLQLVNKTNQFNLTTRRFSRGQLEALLRDGEKRVYLYQVSDRFGDSGVVAALVADCSGAVPVLTDFVMSCRVMGKNIEHALVGEVEADLRKSGYSRLRGRYVPTAKNGPVAGLYGRLGYEKIGDIEGGGAEYEIGLAEAPERMADVKMEQK